jgi:hypothetical protein
MIKSIESRYIEPDIDMWQRDGEVPEMGTTEENYFEI